jgi:glycolate oxidase FAD binding subunit
MNIEPATIEELADAVRSHPHVLAVGARTKARLSAVAGYLTLVSTRRLLGVTEYEPDEFTFTALAGTPVRAIAATLAEEGQYLPFDPMLVEAGATIGGTVAAGLAGPGRHRFGGVRDFILGARFVDGRGRLLRVGGRVVKNAAGFDLPKFFVGSLGRFGVLAELTFKVFPRPSASSTLRIPVRDIDDACKLFAAVGAARWEAEAIDLPPAGDAALVRIAAPSEALVPILGDIIARHGGSVLGPETAKAGWSRLAEFEWAHTDGELLKIATTPAELPMLAAAVRAIAGARMHVSAAGNLALVSLPSGAPSWATPALTLRGRGPLFPGAKPAPAITAAVKRALDPDGRFPSFND